MSTSEDRRGAAEPSFLNGANAAYVEHLHARWAEDPSSVPESWRAFLEGVEEGAEAVRERPSWARADWPPVQNGELVSALDGQWDNAGAAAGAAAAKIAGRDPGLSAEAVRAATLDSIRAIMFIRAHRVRGHLAANLDPLGIVNVDEAPELNPASYGFEPDDMDRPIFLDDVLGLETATMREIDEIVKRTYCGTFALQYMHISNPEESQWLKERIEGRDKEVSFTPEGRKAILNKLVEAEGFEKFLHVKYTGTKRFGIDGGEALVPAMEQIIKRGGALGAEEIVIGMPHRGRLNVLANVMGKPKRAIFNEFQGGSFKPEDVDGSGDVKYHLGASSDREFDGNTVHLSLTANPSHLEAVNPVVLGKARAKQAQREDRTERDSVIPVLLHGDAAFAGQGVVAECFSLSGLTGYRTGGAIHIVVNNQIGFTTAPRYSRSSPYPSDIALMVEAPIFHVNGDDPEAVTHAAKVATEYRQQFNKDVVIDIFCYRRFGHNEGDEPMFTQPLMYKRIKEHPSVVDIYGGRLVEEGVVTAAELETMQAEERDALQAEFDAAEDYRPNKADWLDGRWSGLATGKGEYQRGSTGYTVARLRELGATLTSAPDGFALHRTVGRLLDAKRKMLESGEGLDWATGEALAFASLIDEGFPVRLSGQDSTRGTFSQRHSAFIDQNTEDRHYPLKQVGEDDRYEVIDSPLSEYAVLGFEYGYTLSEPNALVLWEAQFGDFVNGAQIMIDQFISSGERKWLRMSGLVMLLPHGYEGQGPEHSSARPERFLQMSAEENWIVANCTTPANYFHILRRQMHRDFRKPLILFTPKSLLRHKKAVSRLDELGEGSSFHRVLWDDAQHGLSDLTLKSDEAIRRVVLCSGKVYFDLLEERDARGLEDVYLLRVEQLYPFAAMALLEELKRFPQAEVIWCQEEPRNQGAWTFMEPNIEWVLRKTGAAHQRPRYAGREAAASPATGLASQHKAQQEALIDDALTLDAS